MFPKFLCIGANKGGTTWLYYNLRQHKSVWLPPHKEIHYFDRLWPDEMYSNGFEIEREAQESASTIDVERLNWFRKFGLGRPRDETWYASLFEGTEDKVSGDITPAYSIIDEKMVAHAHTLMPNAKIIFIMRNPIERAWSQLRFNFGLRNIQWDQVQDETINAHINSKASEIRTNYTRTIRNWSSCFPLNQIKFVFFDDLTRDPKSFLEEICNFLELDYDFDVFKDTIGIRWNESAKREMEPHIARIIARKYSREIANLEAIFGGVTTEWLDRCNQIIASP